MISLLTEYLLQYRRVSIPHIGSFELVHQPAQWRVAGQLVLPPGYTTAYLQPDGVTEHQSRFFSAAGDLSLFGQQLRTRLNKEPLQWNGFGTLRATGDKVVFEPQPVSLDALQPLPAQKVLRPDARHQVLVGDREVSKQVTTTAVTEKTKVYDWEMITGWILLALSIAAIVYFLYEGQFSPSATGLRIPFRSGLLFN